MLMKMVQFLDRIKKENSDIQSVISWLHKELHKKEMDIKVNMNLSMTESINIIEGALQLLKMGKFTWSGLEIVCNLMLKMSDENHDIKLATVHASKGLEHRHVIFMGINRMRRLLSDKNDNVLQEKNLLYVAVTRSMQTLVYVTV
jgi:superfamily I DNA/RNA helicase